MNYFNYEIILAVIILLFCEEFAEIHFSGNREDGEEVAEEMCEVSVC